jgi:F0F1-type ATP synthase assembly protein I
MKKVDALPLLLRAATAGTELAFSILGGGILGYAAGSLFGETSRYAGLVVGVLAGLAAGTYRLYRKFG